MNAEILKGMLEKRSGHAITCAADCEWLALDFYARLGETIGVNTLKRLLAFLDYDGKTFRQSTLNIVARYLGFKEWDEVERASRDCVSAFGYNPELVDASEIAPGDKVMVAYKPDRELTFLCLDNETFSVSESVNSKLCVGDVAKIRQFVIVYPLLVIDVVRNGKSLGEYTAAKVGGLTSIGLMKAKG